MRLESILFTFENNAGPTDLRTYGRTNGRTDGRTDTTSYRDATAHLKMDRYRFPILFSFYGFSLRFCRRFLLPRRLPPRDMAPSTQLSPTFARPPRLPLTHLPSLLLPPHHPPGHLSPPPSQPRYSFSPLLWHNSSGITSSCLDVSLWTRLMVALAVGTTAVKASVH